MIQQNTNKNIALLATFAIITSVSLMLPILPAHKVSADCTSQLGSNGQESTYCLLAPLPSSANVNSETTSVTFSSYIVTVFKLSIGVAAGLAVLMIAWGGIKYMTSDVISNKAGAKTTIQNALLGLLLALASYLILNTIGGSSLVSFNLSLPPLPTAVGSNQNLNPNQNSVCGQTCPTGTTCNENPLDGNYGNCE